MLPYSNSVKAWKIMNIKSINHLFCNSSTGLLTQKYGIMMSYSVITTKLHDAHILLINRISEPVPVQQRARGAVLEDGEVVTAPLRSWMRFNHMEQCRGGPALSLSDVNCDADYLPFGNATSCRTS